jgi:hypothetical protein
MLEKIGHYCALGLVGICAIGFLGGIGMVIVGVVIKLAGM